MADVPHAEAHSEHELCFATYYDITAQVPKEFQDPSGTMFRFSGQELRQDPQALQRLVDAAEKAKVELSSVTQTQVNLPFITADASGPKHLTATVTRAKT